MCPPPKWRYVCPLKYGYVGGVSSEIGVCVSSGIGVCVSSSGIGGMCVYTFHWELKCMFVPVVIDLFPLNYVIMTFWWAKECVNWNSCTKMKSFWRCLSMKGTATVKTNGTECC